MIVESPLYEMSNPPKDRSGYYGIVLKPEYMPIWLLKLRKKKMIRLGWLNMPSTTTDERWWFDQTKKNDYGQSKEVKPYYWCKVRSYYNVSVEFLGGSPFNCNIKNPNGGKYRVAQ